MTKQKNREESILKKSEPILKMAKLIANISVKSANRSSTNPEYPETCNELLNFNFFNPFQVLQCFKLLHRTRREIFKGDQHALSGGIDLCVMAKQWPLLKDNLGCLTETPVFLN